MLFSSNPGWQNPESWRFHSPRTTRCKPPLETRWKLES